MSENENSTKETLEEIRAVLDDDGLSNDEKLEVILSITDDFEESDEEQDEV
jgi:hypothetical protein